MPSVRKRFCGGGGGGGDSGGVIVPYTRYQVPWYQIPGTM